MDKAKTLAQGLDLGAYNDSALPCISFAEVKMVDGVCEQTGRSVLVEKEEWRGSAGYPVSDAIVQFFGELLQTHPDCEELMAKYGITFLVEES